MNDRIPRAAADDYTEEAVQARRAWLNIRNGDDYPHLYSQSHTEYSSMRGVIENVVGSVCVPVGIAGPVLVNGEKAKGEFVIPLATTEGTLIASFSRGMRAMSKSGGCNVSSFPNVWNGPGPYRFRGGALTKISAVFLKNERLATRFAAWIADNGSKMKEEADRTSRFLSLQEIVPVFHGNVVGLACRYETGNAMGLNMATKGNEAICRYIVKNSKEVVPRFLNTLGGDKRFVPDEAKGRYVTASATLTPDVLARDLRTSAAAMQEFLDVSNLILGQFGISAPNIHIANAITAFYIACGQDPAFVTATFRKARTSFQVATDGALVATVSLPNIIVGTVGGGTKLPTQRDCLRMIDCEDNPQKLAELAAVAALAGEISVAAAVSAGEFTSAHTTLGRGIGPVADQKRE